MLNSSKVQVITWLRTVKEATCHRWKVSKLIRRCAARRLGPATSRCKTRHCRNLWRRPCTVYHPLSCRSRCKTRESARDPLLPKVATVALPPPSCSSPLHSSKERGRPVEPLPIRHHSMGLLSKCNKLLVAAAFTRELLHSRWMLNSRQEPKTGASRSSNHRCNKSSTNTMGQPRMLQQLQEVVINSN